MVKRGIALLSALIMLCMCGCTGGQADDTAINTTETDAPEQTGQAAENETDGQSTAETFPILGLIIDDDGSDSARLTMYGFLRTAETLCYASKVFRAKAGDEAADRKSVV